MSRNNGTGFIDSNNKSGPFISIEPGLDLESASNFINERNDWIETAKEKGMGYPNPGLNDNDIGKTNPNIDNAPIVI